MLIFCGPRVLGCLAKPGPTCCELAGPSGSRSLTTAIVDGWSEKTGPMTVDHRPTAHATATIWRACATWPAAVRAVARVDNACVCNSGSVIERARDSACSYRPALASSSATADIASARGYPAPAAPCDKSAEELMWAYYVEEQAVGRTPTGADLDRVAGANKLRAAGPLPVAC